MEYYRKNELYHHGIKGMKWGQRRWQNSDGTFNEAGKARYFGANSDHRPDSVKEAKQKYKAARKEYNKAFNNAYRHNHPYSFSKKKRLESNARWDEAGEKAEAVRDAKKAYKQAKKSAKIDAVRKYDKAYDEAYKTQKIADESNAKMKAAYKDLGRTGVSRFLQAFKGTIGKGNDAYKRYSVAYDEANLTQKTADEAYQKMRSAYQSTGKNYVDRVLNNIKYGK